MLSFIRNLIPIRQGNASTATVSGGGPCKLWIGGHPERMQPVDDPQGLGGYQLAVEALIRDEAPDVIYLFSDDPGDLSVVRKALAYLSRTGGGGLADPGCGSGGDVRGYGAGVPVGGSESQWGGGSVCRAMTYLPPGTRGEISLTW
jgi:hypothetical protein